MPIEKRIELLSQIKGSNLNCYGLQAQIFKEMRNFKEALDQWNKYDIERPDYESYISKLEIRSRIDAELAEIARQEEARILAEEKARKEAELATLKEEEDLNDIIIETDIETKEERIINVHGE